MFNKIKGFTLCASLIVAFFVGMFTAWWLHDSTEERKKRIESMKARPKGYDPLADAVRTYN